MTYGIQSCAAVGNKRIENTGVFRRWRCHLCAKSVLTKRGGETPPDRWWLMDGWAWCCPKCLSNFTGAANGS